MLGRGGLKGGTAEIDATASSQFLSGLLLAAPRYDEGLVLRHTGRRARRRARCRSGMTVQMLPIAGADVDRRPGRSRVDRPPGPLRGGEIAVPPDLSSAAPFVAAAVATGGRVRVPGWPRRSFQPGDRLPELLQAMGGPACSTTAG